MVDKYKIKKFPKVIVIRAGHKKPEEYSGEINYQKLYDWLNVFSETFVSGGGEETSAKKPWISESVPELTRDSGDDICFKSEALCVIYLNEQSQLDPGVFENLKLAF